MESSTTSFVHAPRPVYSSYAAPSAATTTTIHPTTFYDPYASNIYPPYASQKQPLYVNHSFPPSSTPSSSSDAVAAAAAAAAVAASTCVDLTQTAPSLPPLSRLLPHQEKSQQTQSAHRSSGNMIYTPPSYSQDRYMLQNDVVPDYHLYHRHQHQHHEHPTLVVPSNMYAAARPSLPSPPPSITDATHHHHEQQKVFSFVSIPGVNQRKRPRRKFHEIERLYQCNFPGCSKSYGTLNHLNAHVSMQQHGPKRHPSEFKELRKQWRKQKREQQAAAKAAAQEQQQQPPVYNMPTVAAADYHGAFY